MNPSIRDFSLRCSTEGWDNWPPAFTDLIILSGFVLEETEVWSQETWHPKETEVSERSDKLSGSETVLDREFGLSVITERNNRPSFSEMELRWPEVFWLGVGVWRKLWCHTVLDCMSCRSSVGTLGSSRLVVGAGEEVKLSRRAQWRRRQWCWELSVKEEAFWPHHQTCPSPVHPTPSFHYGNHCFPQSFRVFLC